MSIAAINIDKSLLDDEWHIVTKGSSQELFIPPCLRDAAEELLHSADVRDKSLREAMRGEKV